MNEPHTRDDWERSRGLSPQGAIVHSWLSDMAKIVKSLDSNHILLTGEEGYRVDGPSYESGISQGWINNGLKGVDFSKNVLIPEIDAATVHAYPDNWNYDSSSYTKYGEEFIKDRARIAHDAGKPIIMEEYGRLCVVCCTSNETLVFTTTQYPILVFTYMQG